VARTPLCCEPDQFPVQAKASISISLCDIRVVVFSASVLPYDREKSLELGADDYLSKGWEMEEFVDAAESVCRKLT
jgi:CheY-like chemotaxis protein